MLDQKGPHILGVLALGVLMAGPAEMGAASPATSQSSTEQELFTAKCSSRCLSLHITQLRMTFWSLQNDDILTWCGNNRRCSQCLKPCRALWDAPKNHCWEICATQHECLTSCEFLKTLQTVKQGDCPPAARASGFAAACVQSCEGDRECPGNRKCCFNACGHTCQIPDNINRGVPLRPRKSLTILERSGGTVQVSWKSKSSISIEPVFYVLQSRWHWGLHPSEDDATEWKAMALTMEESAHLDSIGPNRWYQFRVAAVNAHGTRGFTPPSKHFQSSRAPLPPGSPQNLRKGNITASPDGTHSIIISWDPPSEGALAVHHYRVSWGCWAPEADGPSPKMRRSLRVTRAKPEVRLDGLEAGTAYQVQVRTVAFWSQKRLKSPKSQMLIVMPAGELLNELPAAQRVPALRVQVESPYYLQNDLQVNVQWRGASSRRPGIYLLTWRPISCATNHTASATQALVQGTHFTITRLLFTCTYEVIVQLKGKKEQISGTVTFTAEPPGVKSPEYQALQAPSTSQGLANARWPLAD